MVEKEEEGCQEQVSQKFPLLISTPLAPSQELALYLEQQDDQQGTPKEDAVARKNAEQKQGIWKSFKDEPITDTKQVEPVEPLVAEQEGPDCQLMPMQR